jgi:hypothetical protein
MLLLTAAFCMPAVAAESDQPVRIVIMRLQQGLGMKYPADILEVRDGHPEFVGRLWQGEKLVLLTTPTAKKYMTLGYGTQGEFLFTEPLMPGKTYYVMLRYQAASGAMTPVPIRPGSFFLPDAPAVTSAIAEYKTVGFRNGQSFFAKEKERQKSFVEREYRRIDELYAKKTPDQLAERTLHPQDYDGSTRQAAPAPAVTPAPTATVTRRLEELNTLRDRGLITSEEWAEKRKAILKDL